VIVRLCHFKTWSPLYFISTSNRRIAVEQSRKRWRTAECVIVACYILKVNEINNGEKKWDGVSGWGEWVSGWVDGWMDGWMKE